MNLLHSFVNVFPTKACPKRGVTIDNAIPGLPEGRNVEIFVQRANQLLDIDAGLPRVEAVKQHALLDSG
jgi:hypothetical protein